MQGKSTRDIAQKTLLNHLHSPARQLFLGGLEQDAHATPQRSLFVQLVKR